MANVTTEYTIVHGESDTELIKAVNDHLQEGWQPVGGPFAANNEAGVGTLFQALIRSYSHS